MPKPVDPQRQRSLRAAAQRLESLQRAGVTNLPKPRRAAAAPAKPNRPGAAGPAAPAPRATAASPAAKPAAPATARPATAKPTGKLSHAALLEIVQREVAGCQLCAELAQTRTQTVFGVGNPQARLVFLGEAPGADEDRRGEPFVGRAGQLLDKIIEASTLKREEVYILNVLKCRPPGNRTPLPDEVSNCRGYLERQLQIIRPEFLCCLGSVAAQALLETTESIGKLRKRFFERDGVHVMCTYHPAYLLRNPNAKRDVWDDMKMLMREMGVVL